MHAIEECPTCKGMFIDGSELHEHVTVITKDTAVEPAKEVTARNLIRPFFLLSKKRCPRDKTKLRYINYGYDSNVLLEECSTCKGLWVENNQVLPLAAYLKSNPELINLGEKIDRNVRHQDLEKTVMSDPRIILTTVPIPVGDTTNRLLAPWIVLGLILLYISLYLLQIFSFNRDSLFLAVGLIPHTIMNGENIYTLITYQLFHANLFHLLGNICSLWIFGDNIEFRFGHWSFLFFYILAGIVSGLVAALLAIDQNIVILGSSGAIAAVLGSYMVLYPKEKIRVLFINSIWAITVWKYLLFWILLQVLGYAAEALSREVSTVSFTAHVIGFVTGISVTVLLARTRFITKEAYIFKNPYFERK